MNICKGHCTASTYESKKLVRGMFKTEYKRCSKCSIFIKYSGIQCPCCGCRLKISPRNSTARKMNRDLRDVARH